VHTISGSGIESNISVSNRISTKYPLTFQWLGVDQIKALILAGGFGTRLRPLSCSRPKLLFSIAGRSIIEWILHQLSENGVDEAVLATNYLADMIKTHLGRAYEGISLHYSLEEKPLGTAGAIKRAERFLGNDENFLVLNGDIISSPPVKKMLQKHSSTNAIATIMLHEAEDPTHFGVADLSRSSRIRRFVEKPRLKDAPSRWINAGVYVLSSQIFGYIKPERRTSIEREVFPILASSGGLYGYKYTGEWFDIGRFEEYRRANAAILSRLSKTKPVVDPKAKVRTGAKLIPPLIIGSGSVIRENAILGPNTSVGETVLVGEECKISDSVIFDKAHLGRCTSITGSIVGEGVVIGDNVKIEAGCVIGDHVLLHDNITLKSSVTVCPHKEVHRSIRHSGMVT